MKPSRASGAQAADDCALEGKERSKMPKDIEGLRHFAEQILSLVHSKGRIRFDQLSEAIEGFSCREFEPGYTWEVKDDTNTTLIWGGMASEVVVEALLFLERNKLTRLEECRLELYETYPNIPIFDSLSQIGDGELRWFPTHLVAGPGHPDAAR